MRGRGLFPGLIRRSTGPVEVLTPIFTDTRVEDWTPTAATITDSADVDPTNPGTLAVEVRETAVSSVHRIQKGSIPIVNGLTYRVQIVVRGVSRDKMQISIGSKSWLGTIASNTPDFAATLTNATFSALGGGWYRKSVDLLATSTGNTILEFRVSATPVSTTYLGEITKGLTFGGILISRVG